MGKAALHVEAHQSLSRLGSLKAISYSNGAIWWTPSQHIRYWGAAGAEDQMNGDDMLSW